MKTISSLNRREFLGATLAASAAALGPLPSALFAADADPFHGLKAGVASFSLRKFPLAKAVAMTRELGVKYLTLKDVHLSLKSTPEELQAAARLVKDAGLVLAGCGVVYMKTEEDARRTFEYAKTAGMPVIVCSPEPELMGAVEKLVKEFDIKAAVHNHGPTDKKYPSPLDVLKLIGQRDPRLGVCMDVGHTVRIGENAAEVIHKCGARMLDFHIKDVTEATAKGKSTIVGKGVIDIPSVLKSLLEIKFAGHMALEYEVDADNPLPGMKASFDYIRQCLAKV